MKINFLLITVITAAISSCSTSYKTGQTPDDVYYSPVRLQGENVRTDSTEYVTVYDNYEDREILLNVHSRRYRRYMNSYNSGYGYNPRYGKPNSIQNTNGPRKTNLGAYNSPDSSKTYNTKSNTGTTTAPVRTFNSGNSSNNKGTAVGNFLRGILNSGNNSNKTYNPDNNTPSRTFDKTNSNSNNNSNTNSNSSSSGSSSSSSSSAPVRTFKNN